MKAWLRLSGYPLLSPLPCCSCQQLYRWRLVLREAMWSPRSWPLMVGCCSALAGWRVIHQHAGNGRAAALGGVAVLLLAVMPGAIIFMLIFAENLAPASFANQPLAPLVSIGIALCVFGGNAPRLARRQGASLGSRGNAT